MSKRKSDNLPLANKLTRKRTASDVSLAQPITEEDTFPSTQESNICGDESLWSVEDVAKKLEDIGLPEAAEKFREDKISGSELDMITEEQLLKIGIEKNGDRLKILKCIRGISETYLRKVFNDPVHGHIEIHPLVVKFIDTPQFQRLRYLKQLGASYFVYPGAAHNRFEHCIGVCHLAGELARTLQKRQPELDITNKDVLCVEIAGLCHNLGHGPFPHLFDGKFIPLVRPGFTYKHEVASVKMFQHMIDTNNLEKYFPKYGLTEQDIEFIKEQIKGPKNCGKGRRYDGREKSNEYLYEIVANQKNGIDVDKWDYLARNCDDLGIKNSFDHQRFMKFARVLEVDGSLQICSRDKFVNFDYGAKTENPIKNVRFYNKKDVTKAVHLAEDQVSLMLPTVFAEQLIRLYCRRADAKSIELATYCFQKWCDDKDLLVDKHKGYKTGVAYRQEGHDMIGRNFKPIRIHTSSLRSCTANMSKRKSDNLPLANDLTGKRTASDVSLAQPITEEDTFPSTQESNFCGDESLWSVEDVAKKLKDIGLPEAAKTFRDEKITGSVLDMITEDRLREMGIDKDDDRWNILKWIRGISEKHQKKVFNDPVHGHIEIHPLCVKIIDTPQFQRLRYLKQLGAGYFVYPGAAHNRFEHSIGVCHLAGELVRTLQKRQPGLDITNKDVLCVEIAGLCHDLGHGPFSHLFDKKFIPLARPGLKWKHEDASVTMFEHMIDTNNLMDYFSQYDLTAQDINFIKEQIKYPLENCGKVGREESKEFLYEIVANKRNGIDVDKWDYLARDCHGLGIKNSFDHQRFMKFARVLKVDGSLQICSRDKEADTLYNMFHIRATLHKRACQHRVCDAVEIMITDAFKHAEETKLVPGKDGNMFSISECIDDPVAYTNLNDSIFHVLLMSTDKKLKESRDILERVQRRELYKYIEETKPKKGQTEDDVKKVTQEIMGHCPQEPGNMLDSDDLVVHFVNFDYGDNTENPIDHVKFYNKINVTRPISLPKDQVSLMLPTVFAEQLIRLYCKKTDKKSIELATYCFQKWCDDKGLSRQDSLTPDKGTDTY